MSGERLAGLLARRLLEEGVAADAAVSVAELHRQLLPYPYCRERLDLASKAEYDMAMLELLGDGRLLDLEDPELEEAVEEEAEAPEPGLGFLEDFAAAQVRPGPALAARLTSGDGPDGGRPADIGPAGGERPVRLVDEDEDGASSERGAGGGVGPDVGPGGGGGGHVPGGGAGPGAGRGSADETAATDDGSASEGSCRACGGDLPPRDDLRFCPWCGADQETRSCGGCGAELVSKWTYCPECGEPADG